MSGKKIGEVAYELYEIDGKIYEVRRKGELPGFQFELPDNYKTNPEIVENVLLDTLYQLQDMHEESKHGYVVALVDATSDCGFRCESGHVKTGFVPHVEELNHDRPSFSPYHIGTGNRLVSDMVMFGNGNWHDGAWIIEKYGYVLGLNFRLITPDYLLNLVGRNGHGMIEGTKLRAARVYSKFSHAKAVYTLGEDGILAEHAAGETKILPQHREAAQPAYKSQEPTVEILHPETLQTVA